MIFLINTKCTQPFWRRFPLSVMALGAALPPEVSWEIWDGNKPEPDSDKRLVARVTAAQETPDPITLLAFSVMPGPQLVSATKLSKLLKARFPEIPIVWGGYSACIRNLYSTLPMSTGSFADKGNGRW